MPEQPKPKSIFGDTGGLPLTPREVLDGFARHRAALAAAAALEAASLPGLPKVWQDGYVISSFGRCVRWKF